MDKIILSINNKKALVELFSEDAPNTISEIKSILPQKIDLHYAKFAGEEVFGILPIIIPLENSKNVNNMEKGTVVYYPERQLFCIYYGDLQEEDANVTVIGKLIADEEFINEMEKVRYNQGISMIIKNGDNDLESYEYISYKHIIDTDSHWHKLPNDLEAIVKREGVMQPGGPIIYAESETRKLADFLWIFYMFYKKEGYINIDLLQSILTQSKNKVGGWCGLTKNAEAFNQYLYLIQNNADKLVVLKDFILYINRLNMWIDLLIPWNEINESIKKYNVGRR